MMSPTYLTHSPEELLAEEAVLAYLRGADLDASWAHARRQHQGFDASLREAEQLLRILEEARARPESSSERFTLNSIWEQIEMATYSDTTLQPIAEVAAESTQIVKPQARVIDLHRAKKTNLNRRIYTWAAAIAASLLLLFLLQPDGKTYTTQPGQTQLVFLPDSSAVWLAPDSRLVIEDYADTRDVQLTGEAFFEVVRGTPFTVHTAQGEVSVLGTSFRVESTESTFQVRCQTGRVAVARQAAHVELTPGESVRSEGDGLGELRRESPDTEPAPGAAVIVARETSVEELAERLGRYYARAPSVAPDLRQRRVTIELPTDDLAEATRRLTFVLQVPIDTSTGRLDIGGR